MDTTGSYLFIDCPSGNKVKEEITAETINDPLNFQANDTFDPSGFGIEYEEPLEKNVKDFLTSEDGRTVLSLVRELLDFVGLKYTTSAFETEIEVGKYYMYLGRKRLAENLNLNPDLEGPLIVQVLPQKHNSSRSAAPSETSPVRKVAKRRMRTKKTENVPQDSIRPEVTNVTTLEDPQNLLGLGTEDSLLTSYPSLLSELLSTTSEKQKLDPNKKSISLSSILLSSQSTSSPAVSHESESTQKTSDEITDVSIDTVDLSADSPEDVYGDNYDPDLVAQELSNESCDIGLINEAVKNNHEDNEGCDPPRIIEDFQESTSAENQPVITSVFCGEAVSLLHDKNINIMIEKKIYKKKSKNKKCLEQANSSENEVQPIITSVFSGQAASILQQNMTVPKTTRMSKPPLKNVAKIVTHTEETLEESLDPINELVCDLCVNTSFSCKKDLISHVRDNHFIVKPFTCGICNKSFVSLSILMAHVRKIHIHKRLYVCDVCSKSFSLESRMVQHRISHLRTANMFQCKTCCIYFTNFEQLFEHERSGRHGVRLVRTEEG